MPTVTRQSNKPKVVAPASNGVLGRIAPLQESKVGRLKVSLYGNPKVGKTRFACTFPKPLLIIGSEDGTASVVGTKGVDFVKLERCEEFEELVKGPIADGRWASVVLDTATKMREMRIKEIFESLGMPELPERKPFLYADKIWKQVWVQCGKDMRDFLTPLLNLPNERDLNVIIVAQEQNFSDDEGTTTGDIIRPAIGSALGKSLCMFVNAECDYIGQMFIRQGMLDRKTIVDKKEVITKIPTGKKEFCLRVGPHETFITGFRMPLGRPDPPEVLVDPSYEKIVKLIQG